MGTKVPDGWTYHVPVMAEQVLEFLALNDGDVALDLTVGGGGHLRLLLDRVGPQGRVIGVDKDREAIEWVFRHIDVPGLELFKADFAEIRELLDELGIQGVHGAVADLGVSSRHLDSAERGFSFRLDAPLDMRMDRDAQVRTAADLVNTLSEVELAEIFREYGEEPRAAAAAKAVVRGRRKGAIRSTRELVEVLTPVLAGSKKGRHPVTRCFQALRIAVNHELAALESLLESVPHILLHGGRIVIISYHSLEDRLVKRHFRKLEGRCVCPRGLPECKCGAEKIGKVLTKKVVRPTAGEVRRNPRARSARLRAFEKAA